ncbi:MAG: alpha/beta fold hydrolase [Opitutales bacterium]
MELFHRDLGGAGRPPLVLLPGLLGSGRNWQTAGRDLAEFAHVFALDARNHGQSPHDPVMNYEAMVADTLAWLDAHRLPRVTLLGHSLGGKTAMLLACRHPARVRQLVVVDIAPKDYHGAADRREFAAMNELDLGPLTSRAAAEQQFETRVPGWAMRKFLATNLERDAEGRWRWQINLPVLTAALAGLEKSPLGPNDRFAGPALFVLGGKSNYVTAADRAVMAGHFPAARVETLATAGHNPHLETREAFVALVRTVLDPG